MERWDGLDFDLRTGKLLALTDVLLPSGLATLRTRCESDFDEETCRYALGDAETRARFTIENGGLRLLLEVPGDLLVPWSDLAAG